MGRSNRAHKRKKISHSSEKTHNLDSKVPLTHCTWNDARRERREGGKQIEESSKEGKIHLKR